jgi:hypothetical protein
MELRKRSLGFPKGNFKLWDAVHIILGNDEAMLAYSNAAAATITTAAAVGQPAPVWWGRSVHKLSTRIQNV